MRGDEQSGGRRRGGGERNRLEAGGEGEGSGTGWKQEARVRGTEQSGEIKLEK